MCHTVRRQLVVFGVLTVALSWIPWMLLAASSTDISKGSGAVVFGLAASAPSIAALVLWLVGPRDRVAPRMRPRASWVLLAVGAGAVSPAIPALILDPGRIAAHVSTTVASVGGIFGAIAYTLISGPLSEEFGWRGYLQPRLRLVRRDPLSAAVIMGTVWGCWHVPLFFLRGTGQHDEGLLSCAGACFFGSLFALSYIGLFLVERLRGGVIAAILLHAAWNVTGALMPPTQDLGALMQVVALLGIAAGMGMWWRRHPAAAANSSLPHAATPLGVEALDRGGHRG